MSQKSRKLSGFFGVEGQGPPAVSSLQKLNVKDGFFAGIVQSNSLSPLAEDRSHGFFLSENRQCKMAGSPRAAQILSSTALGFCSFPQFLIVQQLYAAAPHDLAKAHAGVSVCLHLFVCARVRTFACGHLVDIPCAASGWDPLVLNQQCP